MTSPRRAKALIVRRVTHLDQLADKLREDRVRRVIEPMLSGTDERRATGQDVEYVRDLGLIARDKPVRIANPIYAEVVPRELGWIVQEELDLDTKWYVDEDGGLEVDKLLASFQDFFRRHSEHWKNRFDYEEPWPQILLQAYLHRVVNGGGRIEREYGLGRGRVDLLLVWPQGVRGAGVRGGVQGGAGQGRVGGQGVGGGGADGGVHGPLRCGGGASGGDRPAGGSGLGGEGVSPAAAVEGRGAGGGLGHVTATPSRAPGDQLPRLDIEAHRFAWSGVRRRDETGTEAARRRAKAVILATVRSHHRTARERTTEGSE